MNTLHFFLLVQKEVEKERAQLRGDTPIVSPLNNLPRLKRTSRADRVTAVLGAVQISVSCGRDCVRGVGLGYRNFRGNPTGDAAAAPLVAQEGIVKGNPSLKTGSP